jgi:hypothetical protein
MQGRYKTALRARNYRATSWTMFLVADAQVVDNLGFFGGVRLSTILPAWLTTILIWDRRRALSSSMRRDRASCHQLCLPERTTGDMGRE